MNELFDEFLLIYDANTIEGGFLLCFVFPFGNFGIMLLSGIGCLIFKRFSKFIFDLFGYIFVSSIAAMFLNLALMVVAFAQMGFRIVFFSGIFITVLSYIWISFIFSYLNNLGIQMKNEQLNS